MDENLTVCEALAVREGKIVDMGDGGELLSRYNDAQVFDLKGKTVIPGLIDTHTHIFKAACSEACGEMFIPGSVKELLEDLSERVRHAPEDEWIVYRNTYPLRLKELRYPTKRELDSVAPRHPVAVDGVYSAQLNGRALKMLDLNGIRATGKAICDKSGRLTGTFLNLFPFLSKNYPSAEIPSYEDAYLKAMRCYNKIGITTAVLGSATINDIKVAENLYNAGKQTVRFRYTLMANSGNLSQIPIKTRDSAFSRLCFIKKSVDGGFLTGTALMEHGYENIEAVFSLNNLKEWKGYCSAPVLDLADAIRTANRLELQFCAHCVGSLAAKMLIEAYKLADDGREIKNRRHAIIHADFLDNEILGQIKELGVTLLFQPAWHYMDAQSLPLVLSRAETDRFMPYRDILKSGVRAAAGSDHMVKLDANKSVNPYNPFLGLYNMVTCRGRDGKVYGESQKTDRVEALLCYTRYAAYATFDEDTLGSLETGKSADFLVLNKDYFTCPEHEIKDLSPVMTVVDGKIAAQALR